MTRELQPLKDNTGRRERPWRRYKLANTYLQMAYESVDKKKADRLQECASWLEFSKSDNGLKLRRANFCRVRLCPVCQWRRSLKTYMQMSKIMNEARQQGFKFIMLTLTMRNIEPSELSDGLDHLFKAWNALSKYKAFDNAVCGWYRGTEVTHNMQENTYHPHIHAILAVKPSYFTSRDYLSRDKMQALWARALRADYVPILDMRKIKGDQEKAVAEVAKYAVKPGDVLNFDDWDLTVETVSILDSALNNRRFVAFGGAFKDIHKKLNLDDVEDGDLVTADTDEADDVELERQIFVWHPGHNQYFLQ